MSIENIKNQIDLEKRFEPDFNILYDKYKPFRPNALIIADSLRKSLPFDIEDNVGDKEGTLNDYVYSVRHSNVTTKVTLGVLTVDRKKSCNISLQQKNILFAYKYVIDKDRYFEFISDEAILPMVVYSGEQAEKCTALIWRSPDDNVKLINSLIAEFDGKPQKSELKLNLVDYYASVHFNEARSGCFGVISLFFVTMFSWFFGNYWSV